jgi:hypothetical protein
MIIKPKDYLKEYTFQIVIEKYNCINKYNTKCKARDVFDVHILHILSDQTSRETYLFNIIYTYYEIMVFVH